MNEGSSRMCSAGDQMELSNNPCSDRPYQLINKVIAEFLGDCIFVFIGSLQAVANGGLINAAFAHGLTIFVLVASFGHISGGHFNPAVTLSILLCGKIVPLDALCYMVAQLAGGFVGSLICRTVASGPQWEAIEAGATILGPSSNWYQGLIVEIMMTWLLTQTVMLCAVDTSSNMLAPLAIGLSISADIFAGGMISSASMNPARSFGPAMASLILGGRGVSTSRIWTDQFIYWLGPAIGASITALLYRTIFGRNDSRLFS